MGLLLSCDNAGGPSTAVPTHTPDLPQAHAAEKTPVTPEPPRAQGIVTYDFVNNRHLAHIYDDGLVMDMGAAGSLKYIQGSWNAPWYEGSLENGMDYTYPKGVGGSLRFPLFSPEMTGKTDGNWTVSFRIKPVGKQKADVFFRAASGEEKKIASIHEMADGWGTYTIALPANYAVGQEHTLRIHFARSADISGGRKAAAAIDWIRVSPISVQNDDPARAATVFDPSKKSIHLKAGQRVTWFTMPGEAQTFFARVDGQGSVSVTPEGETTRKYEATGNVITFDAGPLAHKPTRIDFVAAGDVRFEEPAFRTEPGPQVASDARPQYVLVWIIDTLRADHLRIYNPSTDVETPNLEAFAKQAATFASGTVQGNSSLPTSASIFSAAYAPNHGLITEKAKLPDDHVLFGEAFKKAGWETALYSSNGYVSNPRGFARGFDVEVNPIRENRPSDTEYLWPEAEAWLKKTVAEKPDKPALLYINTVDPHVPYDPPVDILKKYTSKSGKVGRVAPRATGELLHDMAGGALKMTPEEAEYLHDLYKGEITYNDVWFQKMLESLEAMGIRDKTMIVVTSDHGEEFGEYGRWGHGISVSQELVDVPFLIGFSPWTREGRRIGQDVEVVDVLPTVLDAASIDVPDSMQGDSLVSLMRDATARHPRPAFSYHNTFLRGARIGSWKYQLFNGDKDPVYELKDGKGGWDARDVSDEKPIARRMMRDTMAFQVGLDTHLNKREHGTPNNHSEALAKWLETKGW